MAGPKSSPPRAGGAGAGGAGKGVPPGDPRVAPGTRLSSRQRWMILGAVVVVAAAGTTASVLAGRHHGTSPTQHVSSGAETEMPSGGLAGRTPALVFRSTTLDRRYGDVAAVSLGDTGAGRALTTMACDRVDYVAGTGLCLTRGNKPPLVSTRAIVFDAAFHTTHTIELAGYPSRTRVSPDGRYGAATNFVNGDSYATMGFSTRTDLLDLRAGTVLFDLEKLHVVRDGKSFQATDFNFWGVTFTSDSQHFYATLGTGGHTYLIQADVATRQATVITDGVECPSLSPDGHRIAFKQRVPGSTVAWRLSVLDLATLRRHPLAETANIDDQAEWYDNNTVMYAAPENAADAQAATAAGLSALSTGGSIATDTWTVPADGSGAPTRLLSGAWSAVVVR